MSDINETLPIVQIDENNLDKECIRLPTSYLRAAHSSAEAKRDLAEAENELKVVQADLAQEIRANPETYGMEKVTEAAITAAIQSSKGYQKAQAAVRNAAYQADIAQALVWALEHKKRTLTLLVELHGMGYFASPKISREGREAVEQMTKRKVRRHED